MLTIPGAPRLARCLARVVLGVAVLGAPLTVAVVAAPPPVAAACPGPVRSPNIDWTLVADPSHCEGGYQDMAGRTIGSVTHDGSQFVGIGTARSSIFETPQAAVYRSTFGTSWTASNVPFDGSAFHRAGVRIAARGKALAIVGGGVAAISTDGTTWRTGTAPPEHAVIADITPGASRWVAVGRASPSGPGAIWTSTDGRSWTGVAAQSSLSGFCPEAVTARATLYVAVGWNCSSSRPRPVVVTSPNGLTWTRRPVADRYGALRDVVALGRGFIAAGEDTSTSGRRGVAFWSSPNGSSWRRVGFFSAVSGPGGEGIAGLAVTSVGVVAIAERGGLTDGRGWSAFYSPTGTSGWRRTGELPNPGYGSEDGDLMTDVVAAGARIVAVGWFNDPDPGSHTQGGLFWRGVVRG